MSDEIAFERVERDYAGFIRYYANHVIDSFPRKPESPIERMLLIGIVGFAVALPRYKFEGTKCSFDESDRWPTFHVDTQAKLGSYRADILIHVTLSGKKLGSIAVECDGHDFHERTKEQAERDRSRDRWMQLEGVHVLRFTGREIYRDVSACAEEVNKLCWRLFNDTKADAE